MDQARNRYSRWKGKDTGEDKESWGLSNSYADFHKYKQVIAAFLFCSIGTGF